MPKSIYAGLFATVSMIATIGAAHAQTAAPVVEEVVVGGLVEGDSYDLLFGATQMKTVEGAAVRATESPALDDSDQPPGLIDQVPGAPRAEAVPVEPAPSPTVKLCASLSETELVTVRLPTEPVLDPTLTYWVDAPLEPVGLLRVR